MRNLAEFFREGVPAFRKAPVPPSRDRDNIYAVDFCFALGWHPKPFAHDRELIKAINKTLSHMTYSRDRAAKTHAQVEGHSHLHGTVKLLRQTWGDFLKSIRPEFLQPQNPQDIHYYLNYHTRNWSTKFGELEAEFEARVKQLALLTEEQERQGIPVECKWKLDQTGWGNLTATAVPLENRDRRPYPLRLKREARERSRHDRD